jgi:tetratricopeptide (TPR) repeat protein
MMPTPTPEAAWALLRQGRLADAMRAAGAVLAQAPDNVSALACRAMARWRLVGVNPETLNELERAVALAPLEASLRHNFGMVLTAAGRIEAAAAQYRVALRLRPTDTMAFWGLTLNTRFTEADELVDAMVALHGDPGLGKLEREFLGFGLAKVFDDLDEPERAIGYAREANALQARPWDLPGAARTVAEIGDLARADAFRRMPTSRHPSRAPVFIVGMPRSGTTLVETMLSRHPDVLALGESGQIPALLTAVRHRRSAAGRPADGSDTSDLPRDWLLARAEAMAKGWATAAAGRSFGVVTDKLPENSQSLGLIAQIFPGARVIHVRRHPLDTGVSNFFQRYGLGQGFSNRLDWIGLRTRQVADALASYRQGLDLPVLEVRYEALVASPEAEIRRIAAFAGLGWDAAMLSPEQSSRAVNTASQWQVRQPIYTRSVGRWRRYEPWLGPMIEAMGGRDWIAAEAGAHIGRPGASIT